MNITVEDSPNGPFNEQFVFKELGKARRIQSLRVDLRGQETWCDVTGVERGGAWVPAQAVKIADSSEGHAFLIYGGAWGLRLRPERWSEKDWDFADKNQWGEAFKVYGNEDDIIYDNP